jgi:predicted small secreted protein
MRMVIVRTLLGILLVAAAGASLSACSNTWQGIKADWHSNTGW